MVIAIINGPNLNLVGSREEDIYGSISFDQYLPELSAEFPMLEIRYFQSNHEGEIIDAIQDAAAYASGILINGGAFTHTSIAIADAIAGINVIAIEIHLSNIAQREPFRHSSYLTGVCKGSIFGLGLDGYRLGILHLQKSTLR
jgi:3-dehydroquinate dehydratase-2